MKSDINLNICNFEQVLSHQIPMRKRFHTSVDMEQGEDRTMKEVWEGRHPTE